MPNYTARTFQIFWQHTAKYKWAVFVVLSSIVIASVASVIGPLFYKDFFNVLTAPGNAPDKIGALQMILVKILMVYAVSWTFWRLSTFFASYFQSRVMADLAYTCFSYLQKHSVAFFNNNFVGALVKKVNRFSNSFEGISDLMLWNVITLIINISLIVVILSRRSLWLGLGVLIWALFYTGFNYVFSLYKLKYDLKRSELNSKSTGVLADTITNHLNIKLFNGYDSEVKNYYKVNDDLQKLRRFTWDLGNIFEAIQAFFNIFLELGIFFLAIHLWTQGKITIGDFVLIQAYIINIMMRLWDFGRMIRRYYEYMAEAQEMTEILETPHEIKDQLGAKDLQVTEGQIEFKQVDFNYRQTRKIITNLNLLIKPKEKVAIVGPSGSGKSTIVHILLRSYDLESGKILIDNQNIAHVKQDSLWQNIALVNQDPILFHRTLKENIRYGRPQASEAEVITAAKMANCHDFIKGFSDKYDTYVGERGVKLSGGERQRVAMARAILKNAPILVLDEATSSLDSESEKLIQEALNNLMKDKTVIVIAHRLSTIMKMDRIIVLDKGQVVEDGSHKELIQKSDGLYKRLWEKQVGGFIG